MTTRILSLSLILIAGCCHNLIAQRPQKQVRPSLVFQYSSWGQVRFEIRDSAEKEYELSCFYTHQGEQIRSVSLTSTEAKYLKPLLQNLKKESYSLSLPEHGVVIISDGESVQIELDAISLGLTYRDTYESAKSHKPIKLLVEWIKQKFPQISTPK